ncbi:MAG: DUF3472 domain-containing protein [Verrucomicrobia bacterium]|nr:DUF3472 domain-containing protein [Verrucomicrobiota bacterium]
MHLWWPAPEAVCFYNEIVVRQSTPGSYFMVCGWDRGYCGIQELGRGRKVFLFSVWDPTRGNNPNAVPREKRVEVLYAAPEARIRRFGGEGTGAQCMWPFAWQTNRTYRICIRATPAGARTAYTAFFYLPDQRRWKELATFRTESGGRFLRGLYSFVEDFRRDGRSVHETRLAEFGHGWVRTLEGKWVPLTKARFTASNSRWESKTNINAGTVNGRFFLATGGDIKMERPLRSALALPQAQPRPPEDLIPISIARGYYLPLIDLAGETERQTVVDYEPGQYLGHPSACLLEDGKTILCVYPKGHGRGAIVYKRSRDGGLTWSERLPTPPSWATSRETPTIHRTYGPHGEKYVILWSGLYPARLAVSKDDGATWSELKPAGEWGGIVVMGSVIPLRPGPGRYLAMFHDDGRFFQARPRPQNPQVMTVYQTFSEDGGLTWSFPQAIWKSSAVHLCEPCVIRSPDGRQLAALFRENRRRRNSFVMFSDDEGRSWSAPRELPGALTGDRHTAVYAPDGRLFISFRDTTLQSPTKGDWVAWVGTYEDIVRGREGQYRVRLMDNKHAWDCAYPGVVLLPDGTITAVTYGHWVEEEPPFIVAVRLKLEELDAKACAPFPELRPADHRPLLRRYKEARR